MPDLIIRDSNLPDGSTGDIVCDGGRITAVGGRAQSPADKEIDARGLFASPPFVDSHFHMDATLSYGRPRVNYSGTLLEGIALWGELKPDLSFDDVQRRARRLCHWAIAKGNLAIRTHVDVCDESLTAVHALIGIREEFKDWLDLQLVAFPQDGYLRSPMARSTLPKALDLGVDVVGGIPHFERSMRDGAESVRLLCEIAHERGLLVDMHCDESDDPMSRHVETLAYHAQRLGMHGRVTGSHLTSMHSMDNYYVSKLLPLMREAGLSAVANPLINITIQGRHDSYPKRRGMTRVPELIEHGINVAFGHDCVMDPWYPLGSHDMLEVAHMGLHVAQMTGVEGMRQAYDAVTVNAARALNLEGYGLEPGCRADIVLLPAKDQIECIRLRPERRYVIRGGKVIAHTPPVCAELTLDGARSPVDFRF